jgi:perosamine synthetase
MQAETHDEIVAVESGDLIPLARPYIDGREEELVREVLRSGRLSLGPMLTQFEDMFAQYIGTRHAVACSSGTTGLHVAAITAGWGPGDEVITSPFSFIASANVIPYVGATPVFADVDPNTFTLDPAAVNAAVTSQTAGLLPVHIFGWPSDTAPFLSLAGEHDLTIVEDACETLGATRDGVIIGSEGSPAVFAFYANKQMTTGEGGMLVTDDDELAGQWRSLINQGRADTGQWLAHDRIGYNYRLSDIASAVGVAQLEKLDRMLQMRLQVASEYTRLLKGLGGVTVPFAQEGYERSWFVYWVLLDEGVDRDAVIQHLSGCGIQSKPYLPCIHLQKPYRDMGFSKGMFPVAESISQRSLALPFYPTLPPSSQNRVVEELGKAITRFGV